MKLPSLIVLIYAVFLLVGGLIAFFKVYSFTSLAMGVISFIILLAAGLSLYRGDKYKTIAYWVALGVSSLLTLFFAARFVATYKIWPPLVLSLVSLFVTLILATSKKKH